MSVTKHLIRTTAVAAAILFAASANAALVTKIEAPVRSITFKAPFQLHAKKGADDKHKDDKRRNRGRGRDDGPNHAGLLTLDDVQVARRGEDDAPGHIRRGRGTDDAPGHIRHGRGSDDDKGTHGRQGRGSNDRGGKGRGSDDRGRDDRGVRRA